MDVVACHKRPVRQWRWVAGMMLAVACAPLSRALPESAVGPDTFLIAHVNLEKIAPSEIEASVQAVLGASAPDMTKEMTEFKEKYQEMMDAGAEGLTVVASGDVSGDKEPEGVAYVKMKSGVDHAAVEAKVREEQAKAAAKNGGKADDMDISWDGDYMVLHKKGTELPKGGDADRMKLFSAAKESGKAVDILFVPTDKIRAKMKEQANGADASAPPWAKDAAAAMADAKSATIAVTLGQAPKIDLMIIAADEAGAKKLADASTQGAQQLKAQADQLKQAGPQLAPMADAMTAIAGALNAKQEGEGVSLSIDVKSVGPAIQQVLPMMMGGGGKPAGQ